MQEGVRQRSAPPPLVHNKLAAPAPDEAKERAPRYQAYDGEAAYLMNVRNGPSRTHADFEEKPRQVIIGLLMVGAVIVLGFRPPEFIRVHIIQESLPGSSFRMAMWASLLFLVVYSSLMSSNSLTSRPHPMLWRALHGWNIWYCMMAVIMLVVPVGDGEIVNSWIFPSGRVVKEGGTLGYDHLACQITRETVWRQFTSIWFFAHFLGWSAKMLMLRDWKMCLVYSTFFELTELSLQSVIPEFQECWWDSVFMDWGGSNIAGMLFGALVLRLLHGKEYRWQRIGETRGFGARAKRSLGQFSPLAWVKYEWNPTHDPRGLVLNAIIWNVMALVEVNSFFLINLMHLPTDHVFNKARQILFVLTAIPAVSEWYHYCKGETERIGHFTWLLMVTEAFETATVIKYWSKLTGGQGSMPPFDVWGPWLASAFTFGVYFVVHCFWRFALNNPTLPFWLRVLKYSAFLPLVFLCRGYAF